MVLLCYIIVSRGFKTREEIGLDLKTPPKQTNLSRYLDPKTMKNECFSFRAFKPKNGGKVGSHGIGRVYEKFPPNSFFTSSHTKDWTKTDAEAREISPLYENLSLVHEGQGGLFGLFGWLMLG